MKKILSMVVAVSILGALVPASALAGGGHYGPYPPRYGYAPSGYHGHGGYGLGAFFAGLLGGAIISTVIHDSHPAVVQAPPPPPARVWVEGRYETRYDRRWVPGHYERDDDEDGGGRVWVPGRYREVPVKVWVEGHWEDRG